MRSNRADSAPIRREKTVQSNIGERLLPVPPHQDRAVDLAQELKNIEDFLIPKLLT